MRESPLLTLDHVIPLMEDDEINFFVQICFSASNYEVEDSTAPDSVKELCRGIKAKKYCPDQIYEEMQNLWPHLFEKSIEEDENPFRISAKQRMRKFLEESGIQADILRIAERGKVTQPIRFIKTMMAYHVRCAFATPNRDVPLPNCPPLDDSDPYEEDRVEGVIIETMEDIFYSSGLYDDIVTIAQITEADEYDQSELVRLTIL
jgi:hypothetical protein